ncbi:MAG: leucine-rich repeat domain-containing protein [Clostridia bacterium]|nr:leucine-rich repeat domain-containing protein [Clostridia bacterium]
MKRRLLLLAVMVLAIASMLAVSVSAELYGESNIYYFDATVEELSSKTTEDALFYARRDSNDIITEYEGAFPKTNSSGNAISWYKLGQATVGSDIFVAVKSFVTTDPTYSTINTSNGMYKFITSAGPTKSNIVSINFPDDSSIKSFSDGSSYGLNARSGDYYPTNSELLFAYFPNTWCDSNRIVQATPVLEVYIHPDAPFNTISGNVYEVPTLNNTAFHGCKSVRKIVFPKTLEVIANGAIAGNAYGAMYYCTSLTEVIFPEGSALTTIGARAFSYCTSLPKLSLPNTVTTIGLRAFEQCHSLQELRLSDNLTTITDGQSLLWESKSLTKLYLPASIVSSMTSLTGSHVFHGTGTKGVIFFTGSLEELNTLKSILEKPTDNQQRINHDNVLDWDSTISDDEYVQMAIDENKYYVVYNYSQCDAFYEGTHIGEEKLVFADTVNTLLSSADVCTVCTRCESTQVTDTKDALFTNKGYSQNGEGAIMQGFVINKEVISFYTEWLGEINYGLVAGVYSYVDNEETKYIHETGELLTLADGEIVAKEKVASVSFDERNQYDAFEMKVSGLTDSLASTKVFCCAYVVYGNTIYYISNKTVTEGNAGTAVSIGEIQ